MKESHNIKKRSDHSKSRSQSPDIYLMKKELR